MIALAALAFTSLATSWEAADAFRAAFITTRTSTVGVVPGSTFQIIGFMTNDSLFSFEEDTNIKEPISVSLETIEFSLTDHKPLGCTIEESLVSYPDNQGSMPVFVSKLVSGGNAEKAGLKVGDVIIGVSGVFDKLQDVSGVGLDKVRSLVSGRNPNEKLVIRVLRGTNVLEQHEVALVELCMSPDGEESWDSCVTSIVGASYDDSEKEEATESQCSDDESECLLNVLQDMWGDEVISTSAESIGVNGEVAADEKPMQQPEQKAPAPWSSRSSPSGTYVRNPKTRKLERID